MSDPIALQFAPAIVPMELELVTQPSQTAEMAAAYMGPPGLSGGGAVAAAIAAHEALPDPHPQYISAGEAAAAAPVQSVAGKTGIVVLVKADVGLGSVDNTTDASKPVSTATLAALGNKVDKVSGKGLSAEDYSATEKAKLFGISVGATANATDAQLRDRSTHTGAQAINTVTGLQAALDDKEATGAAAFAVAMHESLPDPHPQYISAGEAAAAAPVQSVAGKTGIVTLAKADVGLSSADDTSDADKPVSAPQAAAIAAVVGLINVYESMPADPPMYTLFLVKSSADSTAPTVTSFTATSGVASPIPITAFTATDAVGVTGYWVGESSGVPSLADAGWSATAQTSYTTASTGAITLYARARDAAGNISSAATQSVTVPASPTAPYEVEWPYNEAVHTSLFSVQGVSPQTGVALVYTPASARMLSSVQIPMRREIDAGYPGTGTVTLEVRSGSVTGTLLGTVSTATFTEGTVNTRTFTLASPVALSAGVTYFLVLNLTSISGGQALYRVLARAGVGTIWSDATLTWTSYTNQSPLRLEFSA